MSGVPRPLKQGCQGLGKRFFFEKKKQKTFISIG
jgi:hypothetical protein